MTGGHGAHGTFGSSDGGRCKHMPGPESLDGSNGHLVTTVPQLAELVAIGVRFRYLEQRYAERPSVQIQIYLMPVRRLHLEMSLLPRSVGIGNHAA